MVIMEKGHKAIILPTNEQLYANSIANLKDTLKNIETIKCYHNI